MAATEHETEHETETIPGTVMLTRTLAADLAAGGDGRTIEAMIVPYNQVATVADPPRFEPYQEMFLPGAFRQQVTAAGRVRVWLNFEHEQGLRGIVGHCAGLEDRPDGLHGSFRAANGPDGDKALDLVREGLLSGLSLEFIAERSRMLNGVTQRLRARLDKVSLCRFPAYQAAQVLAVREQPELEEEPPPPPSPGPPPPTVTLTNAPAGTTIIAGVPLPEDLRGRLEALGVEPLRRIAISKKPWDGSASRFTDEQYQRSTLLCRPGDEPPKTRCSLPVLEPDGALNINALGAAAAALSGARTPLAGATRDLKAKAARRLLRYYGSAGLDPPPSLRALAGG
jgi:HK97 family phage prohead protease